MSHEGPPAGHEQVEGIFYADGSLNEAYLAEHYGLGAEEAEQMVEFGSHTGTVAQMLADEACPVGGKIQEAYEESGIKGVIEKFEVLGELDAKFSVDVSETTLERERTKTLHVVPDAEDRPPRETDDDLPAPPPETSVPSSLSAEERAVQEENQEDRTEPEVEVEEELVEAPEASEPTGEVETEMHRQDHESPPVLKLVEVESKAPLIREVDKISVIEAPVISAVKTVEPEPAPELITIVEEEAEPLENTTLPENVEFVVSEVETETPPLTESLVVEAPAQVLVASLEAVITDEIPEIEAVETFGLLTDEVFTEQSVDIARQVNEMLSLPEIAEDEVINLAVVEVMEAAEQLQVFLEIGEEAGEALELLEIACQRLLDELDISYDEETIEQFSKLMLVAYASEQALGKLSSAESLVNDDGTHEFKLGQLDLPVLTLRTKHKFPAFRELGKWAITGSAFA